MDNGCVLGGIHRWIWLFDRSASLDFKDVAVARLALASHGYCFWDYHGLSPINNGGVDRSGDCRASGVFTVVCALMVMDVPTSRFPWNEHHCLAFAIRSAISPKAPTCVNKQHYQMLSLPGNCPAFVTTQVCNNTTAALILGFKGRKAQWIISLSLWSLWMVEARWDPEQMGRSGITHSFLVAAPGHVCWTKLIRREIYRAASTSDFAALASCPRD